jgi:hypothetical protein
MRYGGNPGLVWQRKCDQLVPFALPWESWAGAVSERHCTADGVVLATPKPGVRWKAHLFTLFLGRVYFPSPRKRCTRARKISATAATLCNVAVRSLIVTNNQTSLTAKSSRGRSGGHCRGRYGKAGRITLSSAFYGPWPWAKRLPSALWSSAAPAPADPR